MIDVMVRKEKWFGADGNVTTTLTAILPDFHKGDELLLNGEVIPYNVISSFGSVASIARKCFFDACDDRNGWATLFAGLCYHRGGIISTPEWWNWIYPLGSGNDHDMIDPRDALRSHHLYYDEDTKGWRTSFWCCT